MDGNTSWFAGLNLEGDEYRVRSSAGTGKVESDFRVQELNLYVGGIKRFTDNVSAFARLGTTLAGDHSFRTPTGTEVGGQLDPTLMFEIGLGWDF